MRKVNELVIRGEPAEVIKLIDRMENPPKGGWKRKPTMDWVNGPFFATYRFETDGVTDLPAATLLLRKRSLGELYLASVLPVERKQLTEEEYNLILDRFFEDFVKPKVEGIEVEARIYPFRVVLKRILSPEALHKLGLFVEAADKSNLNSFDRLRWSRFVTQCHIDDAELELEELGWWLRESGWPEEQCLSLVEWYGEGRSLLKEYDEERAR